MIFFILVLLVAPLTNQRPIYLSSVFRHGARYPVNDLYDGKQTRDFHGNLTTIGLRQHFLLGSYLSQDYAGKTQSFNQTLKPRQVQVFTLTDSERCIESAYAHALGMFNFYKGEVIDSSIGRQLLEPPFEALIPMNLQHQGENDDYALGYGYQPVPIRYGDNFFPYCDNIQQVFTRQGKKIQKTLLQLQEQFLLFTERMGIMFKLPIGQIQVLGLMDLYDTLISDKYLGRLMPQKLTHEDLSKLQFIDQYIFALLFEGEPARIFNEPFLKAMLLNMQLVTKGQLGNKKLSAYSVHDANVVPLMLFLNLTSAQCLKRQFKNETVKGNCAIPIPFASNLLFQLHQSQNPSDQMKFYVKVRYNGNYMRLCQKQSMECEFFQFSQRCKRDLMDFSKECSKNKIFINDILLTQ